MKYLIVGLGNIGEEYKNTRHNIGFLIADALASNLDAHFDSDRQAFVATGTYKGRSITIIKPTTYMNLSGKAVGYWMHKEKIPIENVLVLVDDIAIPFGSIRIKSKGSAGGHNGLKSIEENLSHQEYVRLRFGIGDDFHKGRQIDYVLGEWNAKELFTLNERIFVAVEAVKNFIFVGLDKTMSGFNKK